MQVCSFPAVLCGSELAVSNSHHTAEVISLHLPQFLNKMKHTTDSGKLRR